MVNKKIKWWSPKVEKKLALYEKSEIFAEVVIAGIIVLLLIILVTG